MELIIFLAIQIIMLVVFGVVVFNRLRAHGQGDLQTVIREELRLAREESARSAKELRQEVAENQMRATEGITKVLIALGDDQQKVILKFSDDMGRRLEAIIENYERHGSDLTRNITELKEKNREELEKQGEAIQKQIVDAQRSAKESADGTRNTLDAKLRELQESYEVRMEKMRQTVDEKLQTTLERRLGESFRLVSERLEAVQRGLGEMQSLATGVGDLSRVLTNVKERGTWGEYQLEAILAQILTPGQYAKNVQPTEGSERVEFAVKLPGKGDIGGKPVWLPIDSKFPKEDFERLVDAARRADTQGVDESTKALAAAIMKSAKDIHDKYIFPPDTTDFGILFLPTEGLYAEVLRQPGLHDELQRKYRIMVAGPTTLSAVLSSLRVGFQTLAIEQRAQEIWTVLGAVKTEFGKFGDVLSKVKKQLGAASKTLDHTETRSRAMHRALRGVSELQEAEAKKILVLPEFVDGEEGVDENPSDDEIHDS